MTEIDIFQFVFPGFAVKYFLDMIRERVGREMSTGYLLKGKKYMEVRQRCVYFVV